MPKIVDHDARREEVLAALWRVVRRRGLDGASIREIAQEAGLSMGAMTYYFADKDDLLIQAHRLAFERTAARVAEVTAGRSGLGALRAALLASLPLDEERIAEAHVDIAFWARALTNDRLRAAHEASHAWALGLCAELLAAARAAGEVSSPVPDGELAERALVLLDGLTGHTLLYRWDAARVRAHVDGFLAAL